LLALHWICHEGALFVFSEKNNYNKRNMKIKQGGPADDSRIY
jgi:hypothetical protein